MVITGRDAVGVRRLLSLLAVSVTLLLCTSHVGRAGEGEHAPRVEDTYSYGAGPRQRLFAYWHQDRGTHERPRSAVVILHGGYWYQDRPVGWNPWAERFADAGNVVFDVDYRRNIDAPWPAQRRDVMRALRWIRERAAKFGVDPRRIFLIGSSAGGHLATSVGTYGAGRRSVAGVVGLSPVADPYRAWREGAGRGAGEGRTRKALKAQNVRANAVLLAGCTPAPVMAPDGERARCARVWRDLSAARRASGADDAPMLLFHSRGDFVPVSHSRDLARAEIRAGAPAGDTTVVTVPGTGHGGALLRAPGVAESVLSWIRARS